MPFDGQRQFIPAHAGAVVADADQAAPAIEEGDLHPPGIRVHGILRKLLHNACRAFDHFAGSNAVDGGFGKLADGHESQPRESVSVLQPLSRTRLSSLSPWFT